MVRVRNYHGGKEKWVLGTIVKKLGPRTFQVRVQGELRMCHLDQLIASAEKPYEEIEDDLGEWLPTKGESTVSEDQNSEGLDISSQYHLKNQVGKPDVILNEVNERPKD